MESRCVGDIVGPWVEPEWDSGLIERLRRSWSIPINELSNEMVATFLRQEIATDVLLEEAKRRLELGFDDESELYEGELASVMKNTCERRNRPSP
jgi:hypothetical protein